MDIFLPPFLPSERRSVAFLNVCSQTESCDASFFYQYVAADAAGFVNVQNRGQPFDLSTGFYVPFMHLSSSHLPPHVPSVRKDPISFLKMLPRTALPSSFSTRGVAPSSLYPGLLTFNPSDDLRRLSMVVKKFRIVQLPIFTFSHFPIFIFILSFSLSVVPFVPVVPSFFPSFGRPLRPSLPSHPLPHLPGSPYTTFFTSSAHSVGVLVWSKVCQGIGFPKVMVKLFPRCLNISSGSKSISMPNFMPINFLKLQNR